jgi:SAM-dependent methyltransferase
VSGAYAERCPTWHQEDSRWKVEQLMRCAPPGVWAADGDAALRVVDIGCGAGGVLGELANVLAARGTRMAGLGIDIGEEALAMARKRWPELAFRCQSAAGLEGTYDVGLLMDVIEHVENPWQLIRDAARACRHLVFHIPLDDNVLTEAANLYGHKAESMGHIHFYTRRKALWLMESNGLEVLAHRLTKAFAVESSLALSARHRMLSYPRRIMAAVSPAACARLLGGMSLMIVARPRAARSAR